jgi:hypothetical protein
VVLSKTGSDARAPIVPHKGNLRRRPEKGEDGKAYHARGGKTMSLIGGSFGIARSRSHKPSSRSCRFGVAIVAVFASDFVAKAGWLLPMPCCQAPDPMTDDRLNTESAGRPWLMGAAGKSRPARRRGLDGREGHACRRRASPNQVPHASPVLLPLSHYCSKKPASAYLSRDQRLDPWRVDRHGIVVGKRSGKKMVNCA